LYFKMAATQTSTCIDSAGRTIVFASGIDLPGDGTGTITTPQRKNIFAKTQVSAAVRKRAGWDGRKLSATGPVEKMQEALTMANDMILESQRSGNINIDTPAYEDDPLEKMKPAPKKQKRHKSQHPAASSSSPQNSWRPSVVVPPAPWQQSLMQQSHMQQSHMTPWQQNAWPPSPLHMQPAWPPPQQPPAMQLVQMMLQAIGGMPQQPMYPQPQSQFVPPMPPPTYPPTIQYLQPNFAKEQSEGPEVGSGEEEEESEEEESSYEDSAIEHEAPPVPVPAKVSKPRRPPVPPPVPVPAKVLKPRRTSQQKEDDGLQRLPPQPRHDRSPPRDRSTSPLPQRKMPTMRLTEAILPPEADANIGNGTGRSSGNDDSNGTAGPHRKREERIKHMTQKKTTRRLVKLVKRKPIG
jgi:hypothetical protein